jgi:hypothetical protein
MRKGWGGGCRADDEGKGRVSKCGTKHCCFVIILFVRHLVSY